MQSIERALALLSRILMYVTALCLAAMMLHVFADVALKYLLNSPIPGTAEVVAHYYMIGAVFLPLPFVEIRNSGISVDLVYNLAGPIARRGMLLLAYLGQAVFFALLAFQSSYAAWEAFGFRDYVSAQVIVTVWPAAFFLPIGFGMATLVSILRIAQILARPDWEQVCAHGPDDEPDQPARDNA